MQVMEPQQVLEKLAHRPLRVFEAGDVVLSAGSRTGRLLFLERGAVDIVVDDVEVLRVSEPGAVFGEVALLRDVPRTATVVARTPVRAFRIDREAFDAVVAAAFRQGRLAPASTVGRTSQH